MYSSAPSQIDGQSQSAMQQRPPQQATHAGVYNMPDTSAGQPGQLMSASAQQPQAYSYGQQVRHTMCGYVSPWPCMEGQC